MRIAAVNQDRGIDPGRSKGAAVHLRAMRQAFERLGAEVLPMDHADEASLQEALHATHEQAPLDLIYERYALGRAAAARFAERQGIPLVLEVNAPLADEQRRFRGRPESRQDRANDRLLFGRADCLVAVSEAVRSYALQRGARPAAVMVRHNGIDTRRFNLDADRAATRRRLGLEAHCVIGFHGRRRPWHGFELLVEAVQQAGLDTLHLLVIGEGEFPELDALPAATYTRLGWQAHADMPDLVAAFDLLPLMYPADLPCYFSPLKLAEAMACGVTPVVPELGDLPRIVTHERTGLVYPAGDQQALQASIVRLATEPGLRRDLGLRAAATASAWSWEAIARDVIERCRIRDRAGELPA